MVSQLLKDLDRNCKFLVLVDETLLALHRLRHDQNLQGREFESD